MFTVDASDFDALARDLSAAADKANVQKVRPSVEKAGVNIKKAWDGVATTRHFKIGGLISYDVEESGDSIELEVGIDKVGAGNLGVIAHFGGAHGGGGTLPDPQTFLDAEEPALIKYVGDVVEDLL